MRLRKPRDNVAPHAASPRYRSTPGLSSSNAHSTLSPPYPLRGLANAYHESLRDASPHFREARRNVMRMLCDMRRMERGGERSAGVVPDLHSFSGHWQHSQRLGWRLSLAAHPL